MNKFITIGWWGAYPSAHAATSGYLLQSDGLNILVDCGSGVLSRLQNHIALEQLHAVVLSHYHWDHVADLGCLQYATRILMDLGKRHRPLNIYGPHEDENIQRLDYLKYCHGHIIDENTPLQLGGLRFTFSRNEHPDPSFSMRIEKKDRVLVDIADTGWTDALVRIANRADLLLCEASLYDEFHGRIPGHLTAGEAGQIAAAAGVQHLVLTHLPHFGDHQELIHQAGRVFQGKIDLAQTGQIRQW